LFIGKTGYATADAGDIEILIIVLLGIGDKIIDLGRYLIYTSVHGRYSIALTCWSYTYAPLCTEFFKYNACGTATM
jgi:hypothetical protein